MTRTAFAALVLGLALAGCGTAEPQPARVQAAPALRYRTCQGLSPPLPKVRTVEALNERNVELEDKYPDCAERLRLSRVGVRHVESSL